VSDPILFVITLVLLAGTGAMLLFFGRIGDGLRSNVRAALGSSVVLVLLCEVTFMFILGEHLLEQFKGH